MLKANSCNGIWISASKEIWWVETRTALVVPWAFQIDQEKTGKFIIKRWSSQIETKTYNWLVYLTYVVHASLPSVETVPVFRSSEQTQRILGLQPGDKAAMLGVNTIEFLLWEFTWKKSLEFLLFLTTNMTAVTSLANEQLRSRLGWTIKSFRVKEEDEDDI